jgi:hypothetical protein
VIQDMAQLNEAASSVSPYVSAPRILAPDYVLLVDR